MLKSGESGPTFYGLEAHGVGNSGCAGAERESEPGADLRAVKSARLPANHFKTAQAGIQSTVI
jgi:hypothetical protein